MTFSPVKLKLDRLIIPLPCRYNRDDIWLPILILASHEIRNEIDLNNDRMVIIKKKLQHYNM